MTEVRPLRIHDLPFVYRLTRQGISLDTRFGLMFGDDTLRQAILTGSGKFQSYVLRQSEGTLLGIIHFLGDTHQAKLAYIAPPAEPGDDKAWFKLLDGLNVMAGKRGVVTLIAEVRQVSPEFETLRMAGYATYCRQNLYARQPDSIDSSPVTITTVDAETAGLQTLLGTMTPGLIKHIEPPPIYADACYVAHDNGRIQAGALEFKSGSAVLIEIYWTPAGDLTFRDFLQAVLEKVDAGRKPIYCRIRDYMGCSEDVLRKAGFRLIENQVVMFRHTAVRVVQQSFKLKENSDGGLPLPTSITDLREW